MAIQQESPTPKKSSSDDPMKSSSSCVVAILDGELSCACRETDYCNFAALYTILLSIFHASYSKFTRHSTMFGTGTRYIRSAWNISVPHGIYPFRMEYHNFSWGAVSQLLV